VPALLLTAILLWAYAPESVPQCRRPGIDDFARRDQGDGPPASKPRIAAVNLRRIVDILEGLPRSAPILSRSLARSSNA